VLRNSSLVLVISAISAGVACPQPPPASRFGSDLHEHPARCGLPDYAWLDDPSLGSVLEREAIRAYEPEFLSELFDSLETSGGAIVDRRPRYRAFLDRFRYMTQDKGELAQATGLYAWPIGEGPFPLILMTHGTTGYADACAPAARAVRDVLSADAIIAAALASLGYAVVGSDYLGMKSTGEPSTQRHPYFVGEPTAIASLDAARAAYHLADDDGTKLGPLFIAGASQGGHAAAMAVRYQPHYATDLRPQAALYLIPPLHLVGEARRVLSEDPEPVTLGNMGAVLVGHASWYGVEGGVSSILQPAWASYIERATAESCDLPEIDAPLDEVLQPDAFTAVKSGGEDFELSPWDCMLRESSLVQTSVPRLEDLPALVVTGEADHLVSADIEREGVRRLCADGMQLKLIECAGQDHGGAVETSINQVFDFLDARLADEPLEDVCVDRPAQLCASDPRAFSHASAPKEP
jgi:hypothetical protein